MFQLKKRRGASDKTTSPSANLFLRGFIFGGVLLIFIFQLLGSEKASSFWFHLDYLEQGSTAPTVSFGSPLQQTLWFEQVSGWNTTTKCPTVFAKVESREWEDPNKGRLLYRKIVSKPHFFMSVHNQVYDGNRYSTIYVKGQYYEVEVRSRFEYILRETEWDYESAVTLPLVLDIGGNIGYYTFLSAAWRHAVITFEINPTNILRMCESLHLNTPNPQIGINPSFNHTMQVQIYQQGISDVTGRSFRVTVPENPGSAELSNTTTISSDTASKASAREFTVTTVTLDDFARERGWFEHDKRPHISIVKVDTEGHELQILKGGQELFQAHMAHNVFLEYRIHCFEVVQRILLDHGYVIVEDDFRKHRRVQLDRTDSQKYLKTWTSRMTKQPKGFPFIDLWFRLGHLPPVESQGV